MYQSLLVHIEESPVARISSYSSHISHCTYLVLGVGRCLIFANLGFRVACLMPDPPPLYTPIKHYTLKPAVRNRLGGLAPHNRLVIHVCMSLGYPPPFSLNQVNNIIKERYTELSKPCSLSHIVA